MPPLWIQTFKDQLKFPFLPLWLHLLKERQPLLLGIYYLDLLFTIQLIWSCVLSYLVCLAVVCFLMDCLWGSTLDCPLCFLYIMLNACKLLAGEDSWESFYCKEIKPVNPKGSQSWVFNGKTDAEAPILWPPDAKRWLIGKDPDSGKDWRQKEKGMAEDEMVR